MNEPIDEIVKSIKSGRMSVQRLGSIIAMVDGTRAKGGRNQAVMVSLSTINDLTDEIEACWAEIHEWKTKYEVATLPARTVIR